MCASSENKQEFCARKHGPAWIFATWRMLSFSLMLEGNSCCLDTADSVHRPCANISKLKCFGDTASVCVDRRTWIHYGAKYRIENRREWNTHFSNHQVLLDYFHYGYKYMVLRLVLYVGEFSVEGEFSKLVLKMSLDSFLIYMILRYFLSEGI